MGGLGGTRSGLVILKWWRRRELNRDVARVLSNLHKALRVRRLGKLPIPCNHARISYAKPHDFSLRLYSVTLFEHGYEGALAYRRGARDDHVWILLGAGCPFFTHSSSSALLARITGSRVRRLCRASREGSRSPPGSAATREPRSGVGFIGLLGGTLQQSSRSSDSASLPRKVVENAKQVAIQVCDSELMQLPQL
jgi:hypothetical protein